MSGIPVEACPVHDWLLDSDPALRWQVLHDLTDAPPDEVAAERSRVAVEGWGARLLALRGEDGQMGWWCVFPGRNGSVRSSFNTTICVLEGLLQHERATGGMAETIAARRRADHYLLVTHTFVRREYPHWFLPTAKYPAVGVELPNIAGSPPGADVGLIGGR